MDQSKQSVRITSVCMSLGNIRRPGDVMELSQREAQELILRRLAEPFKLQPEDQPQDNNDTQTPDKRSRK